MKTRKTMRESEEIGYLAHSEQWKMFKWIWDKLILCPQIENIPDVDAITGTMKIQSADGDEYTLTITKDKWREIK